MGWGLFLILFRTVEPQYNETRYNEVQGITNDIFCPNYSIMYGKEPRYNQQNFRITAIRSLSNDDGGVLSMSKKPVKLNVTVLLP